MGYGWGSSDPHIVFTVCSFIYLYWRCKVYPYPVKQIKIIFSQQKRKQPSLPSRNNAFVFVDHTLHQLTSRLRLKRDGTRAETRFRLSAKRTSPFKSAGASVQSTTGSRGVRISGSNAGYTMFWGSVKSTGYPLHSPVSPSVTLPCVTVCHHISTGLYRSPTRLLASVTQFRYLLLAVFSFKSLSVGNPSYISSKVLECTLTV